MIKNLINKLEEKGLTVAFAESMTGGLLSASITKIAGASKVFKGSIIAYTNEIKNRVLYIDEKDIETFGVVSKEIALKMSQAVLNLFNVSFAVGITGDAGPTLQENKTERQAFFAICTKDFCETFEMNFTNETRIEAQKKAVEEVYKKLLFTVTKS
ncbi:MAG: CinA family protein [Acholeplasmataceae bacterium]